MHRDAQNYRVGFSVPVNLSRALLVEDFPPKEQPSDRTQAEQTFNNEPDIERVHVSDLSVHRSAEMLVMFPVYETVGPHILSHKTAYKKVA